MIKKSPAQCKDQPSTHCMRLNTNPGKGYKVLLLFCYLGDLKSYAGFRLGWGGLLHGHLFLGVIFLQGFKRGLELKNVGST
jgi:hypothetical protein